jgi:hypothetical protein
MASLHTRQGKGPIFVVGSPRSGTSILTWCLGQHANILPQEESVWMGEFAVSLGVQFQIGHKRGERSQLSSLNVDRDEFFSTFGDGINDLILRHRNRLEQNCQRSAERNPLQIHSAFKISRSNTEPKSRWVDGTPEYSLYICGLRKLFPDAKFVHIVRDVKATVNSLLNFRPDGHLAFVETEQQAYEYWLRTVQACIQAEQALGSQVVYRLRYDDLLQRPEWAIRGVLEFLGEPFMPACIEPLANQINSSNVSGSFRASDSRTDTNLVERALRLSEQLQQPLADHLPSPYAMHEFVAAFSERVAYTAGLDTQYGLANQEIGRLAAIISCMLTKLNWCGALLAVQLLLAIIVNMTVATSMQALPTAGKLLWLTASVICTGAYLVIRPTSLRHLVARIMRWSLPK